MQFRLDKKKNQYYMKVCPVCNEIFLCKGLCENSEKIFYEEICNCPSDSSQEQKISCGKKSWKYNPSSRQSFQLKDE